jgi:hypothetical protein
MTGKSQINIFYAVQTPQTTINIALDTAYLEGVPPGKQATTGIYLMDNRINMGSTMEGTQNLHTVCYTGDNISWLIMPVDPERDDVVSIIGFTVLTGNVFGGNIGAPQSGTNPAYWIGRAINGKTQSSYQINSLIVDKDGNLFTTHCIVAISTI